MGDVRRVGDIQTRRAKARRFARQHADALAILAMTSLMVFGVWQLSHQQNDARGATDVAACERANLLRSYLAFDNAESIRVLRSSLRGADQTGIGAREQRAREVSLSRRLDAQQQFTPFPCETLR